VGSWFVATLADGPTRQRRRLPFGVPLRGSSDSTVEPRGLGVSRRPVRFGGSPGFPRGVFVHEAPNDRPSDTSVAPPHYARSVIDFRLPVPAARDDAETVSAPPAVKRTKLATIRGAFPRQGPFWGLHRITRRGPAPHAPTHDALSPTTRARCLATPHATRGLRLPVTRTAPSGLGRSTARASWNPTFAHRLLQHARPASTPSCPSILARTG